MGGVVVRGNRDCAPASWRRASGRRAPGRTPRSRDIPDATRARARRRGRGRHRRPAHTAAARVTSDPSVRTLPDDANYKNQNGAR